MNRCPETNKAAAEALRTVAERVYLSVANEPRPKPPYGDDPAVAGELIQFVLDRCAEVTDALCAYANARFEQAPITGQRTIELASGIANGVVLWTRRPAA